MQHTNKWNKRPLVILLGTTLAFNVNAEESGSNNIGEGGNAGNENTTNCVLCNLSGSITAGYSSNLYDKDDHRSVRNITWDGSLSYKLSSNTRLYFSSGGYKALENETGTFATDSVLGASYSSLYRFGETGKVGVSGQFTIPTSETSENDKLNTAFRLAVPVTVTAWDVDFSLTPRLRKNFHEYKTQGGKSLTEWIYSFSVGASYSWEKLTIGASGLGANTQSYQGTRRTGFDYGASLYGTYQFTENWSSSLTAASSGYYTDAERGTLGNIDLFDADKASIIADVTFSF